MEIHYNFDLDLCLRVFCDKEIIKKVQSELRDLKKIVSEIIYHKIMFREYNSWTICLSTRYSCNMPREIFVSVWLSVLYFKILTRQQITLKSSSTRIHFQNNNLYINYISTPLSRFPRSRKIVQFKISESF